MSHRATERSSLLWWRLAYVVLLLGLAGWGFLFVYCDPKPTSWQVALFLALLALIFLETVEADLYRRHQPWELRLLVGLSGAGTSLMRWGRAVVCVVLVVGGGIFILWAIQQGPSPGHSDNTPFVVGILGGVLVSLGLLLGCLLLLQAAEPQEARPPTRASSRHE